MAGNGQNVWIYTHIRLASDVIEHFLIECLKTKTKNTL